MKFRYLLLAIVVFAAIIRLSSLSFVPPSLNWDEVSHGYNAYSLLINGTDEWGMKLPSIFRAFGDYKLPVYIYTTSISIAFFGLNEFSVRLPSALAGTGLVFFTYLLVEKLLKRKEVALLSSLLIAIEPWSFFLSRAALEANLAIFLIVAGVYYWITGIYKKNWYLVFGIVLLGLSVWTYNSARVFVPFILIVLHLIYRKQFWIGGKTRIFLYLLLTVFFFVPMFWQLIHPIGQARYEAVKILDQGAIAYIEQERNTTDLNPLVAKIVFNKVTYFAGFVLQNYFSYLSPQYFFILGGSQYQFSIPNHGIIYLIQVPFLIWGILVSVKNIRKKEYALIVLWFLLAPIAGSLTREAPHVLRSLVMLPIPMLFTSLGIWEAYKYFSKYLLILYIPLLFISFALYLNNYINNYRVMYSSAWQYGYKEAIEYTKRHYDNYDYIIMTKRYGEPHEFVLFYNQWDTKSLLNDPNLNRFNQSNWYWTDGFDKYYFQNDWSIKDYSDKFILESKKEVNCNNKRCLLITSPYNAPEGWNKIHTINFLENTVAFEIYEN